MNPQLQAALRRALRRAQARLRWRKLRPLITKDELNRVRFLVLAHGLLPTRNEPRRTVPSKRVLLAMDSAGRTKLAEKQTPTVPQGVWTPLRRTSSAPALLEREPAPACGCTQCAHCKLRVAQVLAACKWYCACKALGKEAWDKRQPVQFCEPCQKEHAAFRARAYAASNAFSDKEQAALLQLGVGLYASVCARHRA
jgi:hypothetical protein